MSTPTEKRQRKKARSEFALTPEAVAAVKGVHKKLERALTSFMGSAPDRCRRCDALMRGALPCGREVPKVLTLRAPEETDSPPGSPTLKRRAMEPVSPVGPLPESPLPLSGSADLSFPPLPPVIHPPAEATREALLQQLRVLKNEARALIKVLDQVHDWIALNIPALQAEENEGVEVLGAMITEIEGMQEVFRGAYTEEAEFLDGLAKLERRAIKGVDVAAHVQVLEKLTWDNVESGWGGLIRGTLLLETNLAKNMKQLEDPRPQRSHGYM